MTPQEQFRQNQPAIEAWLRGEPIEFYSSFGTWIKSEYPAFLAFQYRPVDTANVRKKADIESRIAALENRVSDWEKSWVKVPPPITKTEAPVRWRRFSD
jgi:hypothetical protein